MHEIKIYGEIVPFEEQWIIDQGGFLKSKLKQLNNINYFSVGSK